MNVLDTLITTAALVALLLAVLRHRQQVLPLPFRIGAVVAPVAQLFSLAEAFIGTTRLNGLIAGHFSEASSEDWLIVNGTNVSEEYFIVMQAFNLIGNVGLLLIAIGLLLLVRRIILEQTPFLQHP